jgi:hypothetical protein
MPGPLLFASLADVVGPCPPMFHPSHQGCHFAPSTVEILVGGGVLLAAAAVFVALVVFLRKRDDAP